MRITCMPTVKQFDKICVTGPLFLQFISRVKCWTAFAPFAESRGFMQSSLLFITILPVFHDTEDLMAIMYIIPT